MGQVGLSFIIRFRSIIVVGLLGGLLGTGLGWLSSSSMTHILLCTAIGGWIGAIIELGLIGLYGVLAIYPTSLFQRLLRHYGLVGLWLMSFPVFIWGGYDAQSSFRAWFGRDQPYPVLGVLTNIGLCGLVVVVLYGIIRPWSFQHSIGRLAFSLIILIGCFVVVASPIVDPPGFQAAQTMWLFLVISILFFASALTSRGLRIQKARQA